MPGLEAKTSYPQCTLLKETTKAGTIYQLELHNRPDNRLTPDFITKSILPALDDVERDWRADAFNGGGAAALVTYGPRDADKFYSNGLDFPLAMRTPMFFPRMLNALLSRMLTFPIPTIAALNGHTFAGGFTLALAHDFRIMKNMEGRKGAMCAMNEVDFGAAIPTGMLGILKAKITSPSSLRKVVLEGQRIFAPEALSLGLVDALGSNADETVKLAIQLGEKFAVKASAQAWGLIKAGIYQQAILDLATDRGNDGLGLHNKLKL